MLIHRLEVFAGFKKFISRVPEQASVLLYIRNVSMYQNLQILKHCSVEICFGCWLRSFVCPWRF